MSCLKNAGAVVLLPCLLLFCLTGCLSQLKSGPEPTPGFSPDLPPDQYAGEIEKLLAATGSPAESERPADGHLQLALLYSSYKNPQRDY